MTGAYEEGDEELRDEPEAQLDVEGLSHGSLLAPLPRPRHELGVPFPSSGIHRLGSSPVRAWSQPRWSSRAMAMHWASSRRERLESVGPRRRVGALLAGLVVASTVVAGTAWTQGRRSSENTAVVSSERIETISVGTDEPSGEKPVLPSSRRPVTPPVRESDANGDAELDEPESLSTVAGFEREGTEPPASALRAARRRAWTCPATVLLVGHTCSLGSHDFNARLGLRRAHAVSEALVDDGIARERIAVQSRGECEPRASNATPEGRLANRRVEVQCLAD